ncbi:WYL domain-containing protein [Phytohabitans flavus]|uniref:DNA-binding transcriptional regulator n=1 Tax=Phytohabitans flavus TaxID=1076124 RepID=A0A6F8Y772_9ACTN|nr:YafY family protein [Phytohabitans flavus]BCB81945.1 DNA-binding transcriptional regulator [Phytohabitans flavus]
MLETSARLLRLLSLLQAKRDWSGAALAERLEVSERTVRRDVERLRDLGYPVHATRGTDGGYRLGAGAAMPPLLLDDDEAVAVAVGLRTAAGGTVAGIEETSVRALAKIEQVLPARLRHRVNALQSYTVPVPPDRPAPTVDPAVLTLLAAACRDAERVRFDYRGHDGTATTRSVEPHRLVSWGRRWYLVGWDVDRQDWRTFRVDRIAPRSPTGPRFAPREDPPGGAAAHVARGVSAAAWRHTARVVVHAPAATVAERINPAVGVVEALDEQTCVLDTGADTIATLAVYLGLLDADFEVTSPPELVSYLRSLSDRYARAT